MYFPTICVDNFFDNPEKIKNFALSLDYEKSTDGIWPGKRTKTLNQISPNYFSLFCEKLFSLFFNLNDSISWKVSTYFQIIEPQQYKNLNQGWVHADRCILSGIIYLNPTISKNCGTSIYRQKVNFTREINSDIKVEMFKDFKGENVDLYQEKLYDNNNLFEETINFSNVYNRLIAYNGHLYHAVNQFSDDSVDRLTQVFFVEEIHSTYFPIPASRQIQL